ncbi:6-phosphogluconate dehydrogenase C-terminal domain-like protein [Pseudovirgaria hyperparasitica]|uniref:6-phosphogluconate dehydrogenase C-terminal domain-like protein n=1 Tax=Pseudovirgaria hyperparasitica TaxID=470096 RepID=A0A6A6W3F9_9PEZI|nr:6-phosphogluconate dehydrogenase C-terminal domain-like protein [Pseudovirgaria hyperparasitica]KAF2756127.1 6-phosphogluconate dehydrogenase C-terminal domain-like protein [Pseudovirgaria hyperparasitica]
MFGLILVKTTQESHTIGVYGGGAVTFRLIDHFASQGRHVYFTAHSDHNSNIMKVQRDGCFTVKRYCSTDENKWEEYVEHRVASLDGPPLVQSALSPKIWATTDLRKLVQQTCDIYISIVSIGDQSENSHKDVITHFLGLDMDLSHLVLTAVNAHAFTVLAEQMGLLERVKMIIDLPVGPYATRNEPNSSPLHNIMKGKKIWLPASYTVSTRINDNIAQLVDQGHQATIGMLKMDIMPLYNAIDAFFNHMNPVFHVPIAYANMSRIDSGESWTFYLNGLTESVKKQIQAFDTDRRAVLKALKFTSSTLTTTDYCNKAYGANYTGEDDFGKRTPVHNRTSGVPTSMNKYRYTLEDGRWCMRAAVFAEAIGVEVLTIKSYAQQTINLLGEEMVERKDQIMTDFGIKGLTQFEVLRKYGRHPDR